MVGIGVAAAQGEAGKAEHNVGRDITIHGEKLAHFFFSLLNQYTTQNHPAITFRKTCLAVKI
jgi:hypothetical protein